MKQGASKRRGFTLLEVMVAVTILGLGLTMILSSQAGLLVSARRVGHDVVVTNLARCRMSELEIELLVKGFPLIDQNDSGECCEGEDDGEYSCSWKVETIELPQPATIEENEDAADGDSQSGNDPLMAMLSGSGLGAPGQEGAAVPSGEDLAGKTPEELASEFASSTPGGPMSIASMAISLIYPTLKPTLEASIRKLTVNVNYREGNKDKSFTVVQYITNPQLFSPDLDPTGQTLSGAASGAPSSSPPPSSGPGPKGPLPSSQGAGQ